MDVLLRNPAGQLIDKFSVTNLSNLADEVQWFVDRDVPVPVGSYLEIGSTRRTIVNTSPVRFHEQAPTESVGAASSTSAPAASELSAPTPAATPSPAPNAAVAAEEKYKGVGGWLLLLCVGLTVLGPLRSVAKMIQGYNQSSPYFDRFPGLKTVAMIDIPLSIGLMGFGIYAGVGLWQVRPRAVQTAKRFFVFMLAYTAVVTFLPFMAGLPSQATSAMMSEVMKGVLQGVVGAAVWLAYLNKSKRVKATYPDAAYEPQ